MVDRYTKIVLTVIAVCLLGICLERLTPQAHAQDATCGTLLNPCYVTSLDPLEVKIAR